MKTRNQDKQKPTFCEPNLKIYQQEYPNSDSDQSEESEEEKVGPFLMEQPKEVSKEQKVKGFNELHERNSIVNKQVESPNEYFNMLNYSIPLDGQRGLYNIVGSI